MKNSFSSLLKCALLLAIVAVSTFALESCSKKDQCGDSCVNGYCADGDCVCQTGYTGKWCATYAGSSSNGSSSTGSSSTGSSSTGSSSTGSSSTGSSSTGSSSTGSSSSGPTSYTVTFWSNFSGSPISVYIGGSYAGSITKYFSSSTPSCGETGCVSKTYSSPTTISYTAEDDDHNWSGSVSVTAACNKMCLTL